MVCERDMHCTDDYLAVTSSILYASHWSFDCQSMFCLEERVNSYLQGSSVKCAVTLVPKRSSIAQPDVMNCLIAKLNERRIASDFCKEVLLVLQFYSILDLSADQAKEQLQMDSELITTR